MTIDPTETERAARVARGPSAEGVVAVNRYRARAHREGSYWVIDVGGVGVTQATRFDQVGPMARDLIAALLDVDVDGIDVEAVGS